MRTSILNSITVALVAVGVFMANLRSTFFDDGLKRISTTQFDYMALGALFIGVLLTRESFMALGQARQLARYDLVFRTLGVVIVVFATLLIGAWSVSFRLIWEGQWHIIKLLEVASSVFFVVSILLLFLRDETVLEAIATADSTLYSFLGYVLGILVPSAIMTGVVFMIFKYNNTVVEHSSIFGICMALVVAIREGYDRARKRNEIRE